MGKQLLRRLFDLAADSHRYVERSAYLSRSSARRSPAGAVQGAWEPSGVDDQIPPVTWSACEPQRYVFAAIAVVLGIAVVVTAVAYIRAGTGGVVPFLMITVGPVLAVVHVY